MTLYIQHGHAKSTKITNAFDDESARGVVFAARNENVANLDKSIARLHDEYKCDILFDPQFYVSTLIPAKDRYLPEEYPYYESGRTAKDFIGRRKVDAYTRQTLDFQAERPLHRLLSPTVIVNSLTDRWSQIAMQLADSSLEYHAGLNDPSPLLVSVVISEGALDSPTELDAFLDTLTGWDVQGYYLVVVRDDPTYSQRFDEGRLARLLYLVHVLGDRNGYEVVCGYSDFVGIPLRAAGATAFATGWYQSLRQFHEKTFKIQKPGGQPPRLRYSSKPLINSIMLDELESIHDTGYLDRALSNVDLDSMIRSATSPQDAGWTTQISERHHWQTLSAMNEDLTGNPKADTAAVIESVREAIGLYTLLRGSGVPFERNTDGEHLREWLRALTTFQHEAGWA